jgi:hypothetical protein
VLRLSALSLLSTESERETGFEPATSTLGRMHSESEYKMGVQNLTLRLVPADHLGVPRDHSTIPGDPGRSHLMDYDLTKDHMQRGVAQTQQHQHPSLDSA